MNIRLIAAAPVLVAGALLVAGTPALSQASDPGAAPGAEKEQARIRAAAARVATDPCVGGTQKKAYSGGNTGWFGADNDSLVPGASFQFQGPSSGKDTVYVTFSAFDTYAQSGEAGQAKVLLDGVAMAPSDTATEYFYESDNYHALTGHYCARVGSGSHRVKVILDSASGTDVYLYNPMLHVEVAD
jgi:hypothetical protein